MNRRELLKLFMASQIPLGGLLEKLPVEGKAVDCKIDGWDMRFDERPDMCHCIQGYASKMIDGKTYCLAMLFDKDDKIEQIRAIMEDELKRFKRRRKIT